MCLLGTSVGQAVASATAEVPSPWWQENLSHPPIARYPADDQRTGKPPPLAAELRRRGLQPNRHRYDFRVIPAVMQVKRRLAIVPNERVADRGLVAADPTPGESSA